MGTGFMRWARGSCRLLQFGDGLVGPCYGQPLGADVAATAAARCHAWECLPPRWQVSVACAQFQVWWFRWCR